MSNEHKERGTGRWIPGALAVLLLLYVLAYFGMVNVAIEYDPARREHAPRVAEYRAPLSELPVAKHHLWSQLFLPIHLLDRKARPATWND